jgi:hypothetical protein
MPNPVATNGLNTVWHPTTMSGGPLAYASCNNHDPAANAITIPAADIGSTAPNPPCWKENVTSLTNTDTSP